MRWGRNQGCDFVSSRCRTRQDDFSVVVRADEADHTCARTYIRSFGGQETVGSLRYSYAPNELLARKCTRPNCQENGQPRQWPRLGTDMLCNAECVELPQRGEEDASDVVGQLNCANAPAGQLFASQQQNDSIATVLQEYLKNAFFTFGLFAFSVVLVMAVAAHCCLKKSHYTALFCCAVGINCVTLLLGAALGALLAWAWTESDKFEVFISETTLQLYGLLPLVMILWAVFGIAAVCYVRKGVVLPICIYIFLLVMVILVQTCFAFVIFVWVKDSYSIEQRTYSVLNLDGVAREDPGGTGVSFVDKPMWVAFDQLEIVLCNTYKRCCWEASYVDRVANVTTCTSTHDAGKMSAIREAADTYSDPSSPSFCMLIAGTKHEHEKMVPPPGVCNAFNHAMVITDSGAEEPVLNKERCAREFCTEGVRGYELFVTRCVDIFRTPFESLELRQYAYLPAQSF
eukprot:SAG31_NODE_1201_length_9418_cov_3.410881_5_plen_458_part_00